MVRKYKNQGDPVEFCRFAIEQCRCSTGAANHSIAAETAESAQVVRPRLLGPLPPVAVFEVDALMGHFRAASDLHTAVSHKCLTVVWWATTSRLGARPHRSVRLVEGTDLARLLTEHGALSPARAVSITRQIAAALDAAHSAGLIHRKLQTRQRVATQCPY